MKKVVLLAGVIAAGMAAAPQAANAAAPTTPGVDDINLSADEINDVKTAAQNYLKKLNDLKGNPTLFAAAVASADQDIINNAIDDLGMLISECDKLNDTANNSDYFFEAGALNNIGAPIGWTQARRGTLLVVPGNSSVQDWVKRYAADLTQYTSTIDDLEGLMEAYAEPAFTRAQAAIVAAVGTMTPAEILDANATTAAGVDKTALETILEEALDILGAYDSNYQDPAGDKSDIYDADIYGGKDGAINTKFDATVKGQIEAAIQLLERIEAAKNKDLTVDDTLDDQLLNQFELQTDVNVLTPLLEGYVVTFKIEANHVAADNLKDELTAEFANLKHHQDCKHTDTHKVADEIQATIDQLDPDATWDAELDLHVRANTDPAAVTAWEAFLNGTSVPAVTSLYKTALGWDVTDLAEAIDAFEDRYTALEDCDVKDFVKSFLWTGKTVAGTIAKEYEDLKNDIAALGATVTPAEFAALDQRVTDLYDRLANVDKAWNDIAKLDKDDHDLQKEITDAATEDGYDSTTITAKWGTEQTELDTLEGQITDAILAITKDAEFTGYDTFEPTITLEYDHHAWLAEYQQENYDATQTMLAAIDVRFAEYQKVANFAITSDDPENPMALADGTELYTTDTNKGVALNSILGEETTTKLIYVDKFFAEIAEHFGNDDHTVDAATPVVKDSKPVDLMYDLITKWYNDADAQYLGTKNYVDDKWNEAERKGELKNNTVEGLQVTTSATDASGILVFAPEATTAGNEVVFGWLQKEIQNAFARAVENEKANKDIHDKRAEVEKYVADAKTFIDTEAHLTIAATDVPAREYDTYDMAARKDVMDPEAAYTTNSYLNYEGEYRSLKANNFKVEADLGADFYTKEDEQTAPTNTSVDYLPEFDCGHNLTETPNDHVWGWDKIGTVLLELEKLEKKEYDKVASLALLNGTTKMDLDTDGVNETFEETLAEVKENVDDITNEAFTQLYKNGLALVQQELVDAKAWAAALDAECEEHAADHPCSALDVKNNPCGWDNTGVTGDAYSMLKAIVEAWNTERALIATTDHNAEENDTVEKRDAFTAYVVKALNDIRDWKVKFAAMDKEHKIKLNAALDLAQKEALTMEHYAQEAKNAKANFSVDGADKATADNWAVDFNVRKFPFVDGQEHTFVEILKVLKADIDAAHVHVTPPYADDKYAGLEEVLANGITCFDDYIKATDFVKKLSEDYAQAKYDHHLYTDLKTFADGLEKFNWNADFNKWLEANKDCHVRMETVLADLKVAADAIDIEASELYGDEYNGGVDNTTKTQLDALRTEINTLIANQKEAVLKLYKDGEAFEVKDHQPGNINAVEVTLADGETKAKYDPTAIQNKINALNTALAAAKTLYADNAAAKAKYEAELAQIESELAAFKNEAKAVVDNGEVYVKSTTVTAPKNDKTIEAAIKAVTDALASEADHITNGFNAGILAYDGAEVEDTKDNKTEVEKHLADARTKLQAARTALEEAQALYAQNKAALDKFTEELKTVAATKAGIDTVLENADVYDVITPDATDDADDVLSKSGIVAAKEKAYNDLYTAETAASHIAADFASGVLSAKETEHDGHIVALTEAVKAYEDAVLKAINFKAQNVADYNELMDLFNNAATDLKLFVDELANTDEIYEVEGHKDKTAIYTAFANLQYNEDAAEIDFAQVQAALEAALANGTVTATKADLEEQIGQLSDGVSDLRTELKGYVDFYKAEHALAADYNEQLANLEILFKSVVPGDIYGDREESNGNVYGDDGQNDMKVIKKLVDEILKDVDGVRTGLIPTEAAAIATDLDAAKVQANKTAHETALAKIEAKIKNLQKAVNDFEQFKADNLAKAQELCEQLRDLKAQVDAIVVEGVYETGTGALQLDAAYINVQIGKLRGSETATRGIIPTLKELEDDLQKGDVLYYTEQWPYYTGNIATYQAELDNIRKVLAEAKKFYSKNYTEYDNLKDAAQALVLDIKGTLAGCLCDLCNGEDNADVQAILDKVEGTATVPGIKDAIEAAMWTTKDIYKHETEPAEGVDTYKKQLEDLAKELGALKAEINNHSEQVKVDQVAYNVLQKALEDLDLQFSLIKTETGWENFAVRDAHNPNDPTLCQGIENNSNPNVKYLNELEDLITNLKLRIEAQHAHEGVAVAEGYVGLGHVCEENKIEDLKVMKGLVAEIQKTIEAIKANEAAHELLQKRFGDLYADAKDAYDFWHQYYNEFNTLLIKNEVANRKWIEKNGSEFEGGWTLDQLQNLLHDYYVHGNAANVWTVEGKGKELNGTANNKFAEYDEDLANDRNELAYTEAKEHAAHVQDLITTYVDNTEAEYTFDGYTDPFVLELYAEWQKLTTGEFGLQAALNHIANTYDGLIKAAYEAGVMEDAINIDNRSTEDGIHQMLEEIIENLLDIESAFEVSFENAHHLTNGKTIYSDQEFFTLGFFREANNGEGNQDEEMFDEVQVLNNGENVMLFQSPAAGVAKTYAVETSVLVNGTKKNEITFVPKKTSTLAVETLLPGDCVAVFDVASLKVKDDKRTWNTWWTTKHEVYIAFNVAAPVVAEGADVDAHATSNKLIVRVDNPIDLSYMLEGLVATTETGSFTYDDVIYNELKGQLEFDLPEGTQSVNLPEGFFTFRTGENTIARSAALTVNVAGATSIESLIAMGEKAQIFDLQGRRVKAEALISGNAYIVNGEKVMVK